MIKKTIEYEDFLGNKREDVYCFHLSQAELVEMELSKDQGLTTFVKRVAKEGKTSKLAELFKDLILKAYGEISDDGKRFVKSQELRDAFEQTNAYSELYVSLLSDTKNAIEFVRGIVPSNLQNRLDNLDLDNITVKDLENPEQLVNKQ